MLLFLGDDWSEERHDVELQDEAGRVLAQAKLPEGMAGMARLHAIVGEYAGEDDEVTVRVGIETERGPWVQALLAAGYQVYAINPLQVARYRERFRVSGAKSDPADAHVLCSMVRSDHQRLRPVAGDSALAEAIKIVTRAHKTLIWERSRHMLRLRQALLDFFPAAVQAFEDLTAPDTLELLAAAPDPASAAALTTEQITDALRRARRRNRAAKAQQIATVLRGQSVDQHESINHVLMFACDLIMHPKASSFDAITYRPALGTHLRGPRRATNPGLPESLAATSPGQDRYGGGGRPAAARRVVTKFDVNRGVLSELAWQ